MHMHNIYKELQWIESSTCKLDLQIQIEGNREVNVYSSMKLGQYNTREKLKSQDITYTKEANTSIQKNRMVYGEKHLYNII